MVIGRSGETPRAAALVAALLVTMIAVAPANVAAHGPPSQGIYVTIAIVDVKKGPGPEHETIRTFHKGKVFEIVGKQGRWLMVRLSEHETTPGYLDGQFAVVKTLHDDPQRRFPIPGSYLTTTPVDVRLGPGREHAVVSTIPPGTRVVVVALEADWLRIASKHGEPPRYIERSRARLQASE
jgi:uncharacterized protein YraI